MGIGGRLARVVILRGTLIIRGMTVSGCFYGGWSGIRSHYWRRSEVEKLEIVCLHRQRSNAIKFRFVKIKNPDVAVGRASI